MSQDVVFICVNYNESDITSKYVTNVLSLNSNFNIKIIIVDNYSSIDDKIKLSNFVKNNSNENLFLLNSDINLGYFKGLNLGIKFAIEKFNFAFLTIGNNDLIFDDDFLYELEISSFDSTVMVLAPDVYTSNGIHENPHIKKRVSFFRRTVYKIYFTHYFIAYLISLIYKPKRRYSGFITEQQYIYMGIGALYILTPNFFKHFSTLWDQVFLYGEEALLAGQIKSVNGNTLYMPSLKCLHYGSSTTSSLKTRKKYNMQQSSYNLYKQYL
jgi:GT2 family glycosyltransferase